MLVFYRFQKAMLEIEGCLTQSPVKTSAGLGGVSAWRSHLLASCLLLLQSYWCSGMAAASLDPKLYFLPGSKSDVRDRVSPAEPDETFRGGVPAWRSHLLASCLLLLQSYWCSGMAEPLPCQLLQAASLDPKLSFSTGFKKRR